jgi:Flp pilus assembly protein TadD
MARILLGILVLGLTGFAQAIGPAAANQSYDKGEYAKAAAELEKLPETQKTAAVWNRLGVSYHMLNRIRDAENAYRRAIRLDSKSAAAYNNLGALYYLQRNFDEADSQFRRAAQRNSQSTIVRRNLTAARYARENVRPARAAAEAQARNFPSLVEETANDYLSVVSLMPPKDRAEALDHGARGDLFMARKLYEDAVIEFRKGIALDRYDASLVNRLGIAYLQTKKFSDATKQFREAIRLNPYFPEAINNLGFIEYMNHHFDDAVARYKRALQIEPNSSTVLKNMSACYFAMHRYEEATKVIQQALEIEPNLYQRIATGTGTLIQMTEPNDPLMHFHLARLFAARGEKDQAMTFLYKAVDAGFDDIKTLKTDSAFASLAADERFARLLDRLSGRG